MEQLGINPTLLATQVINFLILLALLGKFAYRPILKLLEDRRKRIEKGLELARTMEEEKAKLDERTQEVLDKAEAKVEQILTRARETGEKEREKILEQARHEGQEAIKDGLKILQARQEEAQEKMRREVAEMVVSLSEKLLAQTIDKKKHKIIIESQIEELSRKDVSKVH